MEDTTMEKVFSVGRKRKMNEKEDQKEGEKN